MGQKVLEADIRKTFVTIELSAMKWAKSKDDVCAPSLKYSNKGGHDYLTGLPSTISSWPSDFSFSLWIVLVWFGLL